MPHRRGVAEEFGRAVPEVHVGGGDAQKGQQLRLKARKPSHEKAPLESEVEKCTAARPRFYHGGKGLGALGTASGGISFELKIN